MLRSQNEIMQHETYVAKERELEWRKKVRSQVEQMDASDADYRDIATDMARQFKYMQRELETRVNSLVEENNSLREEIATKDADFKALVQSSGERERVLVEETKDLRRKMEVMSDEFATMLRETLDKIGDRLVADASNFGDF